MVEGEPRRVGVSIELKPHAYDPAANPELFEGVLARRVVAFGVDLLIIAVPILFLALFIFMFGLVTLGLGWWLLWPLFVPAVVIWILSYYGMTLGGPASATVGMRAMELEMRTWYGAPCYFVLGAVHTVGFWMTVSVLSPLILVVAFFNDRRRLLHDILLGTVVVNNATRAASLANPPAM
ncbi:MAG: RDD family protein [Proteobacteria bacterium]|nr:RDD family protein [Pseudomonadota bacterium]